MEFISLDVFTFERVSDFYARKYGSGPQQYMRRTYPHWKSGSTKMAGQTVQRILECVPPFLTKEKQFKLLSLQIPSVIQQQKSKMKASGFKASQLESTYCSLAASITEQEYELDWFLKEIFPSSELDEFVNVFKYTMLDCLKQSFSQVRQDLLIMHELLADFDGISKPSYQIALLDCPLDVDVYPLPGDAQLIISMPEPRLVTKFRDHYKQILLDHALAQCRVDAVGGANLQIAFADIEAVITQLESTEM